MITSAHPTVIEQMPIDGTHKNAGIKKFGFTRIFSLYPCEGMAGQRPENRDVKGRPTGRQGQWAGSASREPFTLDDSSGGHRLTNRPPTIRTAKTEYP